MNAQAFEAHALTQCRWQALQLPRTSHVTYAPALPPAKFSAGPYRGTTATLRGGCQPLFQSDCSMYARFQKFVSSLFREGKLQVTAGRKQERDLSCHAVAVERHLDELKSRAGRGEGPNGMPLPDPIHAELSAKEVAGKRIILVGDVHGESLGPGRGSQQPRKASHLRGSDASVLSSLPCI